MKLVLLRVRQLFIRVELFSPLSRFDELPVIWSILLSECKFFFFITVRPGENEIITYYQALAQCFRLRASVWDGNIFHE